MKVSALIAAALTAVTATAGAIGRRGDTPAVPSRYYGISLNIRLNSKQDYPPQYGRSPVELNKLAGYSVFASEISFDPGVGVGVDVKDVACQVFTDADGVLPLGKSFNASAPFNIVDVGLVSIGSILCWVSGELDPAPSIHT